MAATTIVVPVFNGADAVSRCLASLSAWPDVPVVVVDDASTDPAIRPMLEAFRAGRGAVTLIHAPVNSGFIATANAGAEAAGDSDLLFLNADTEVTRGALEELAGAMDAPEAMVACPLSNNATFLSVPRYQQEAPLPDGMGAEDMAAVLAECARGADPVDLPTAVGFCMRVRRDAWRRFGPFDAAYGRGYAEDDDFAQRVRAAGGRIACAPRAFVYHRGHASFGKDDRLAAQRRANGALLASRWPDYLPEMARYCRDNPLRPLHERVWDRVLSWPERRREHILHVVPEWPGREGDAILREARATRATRNHTIVVPTPDRGAWVDAIDGPSEPGIRWVGLVNAAERLERFISASPATDVRYYGEMKKAR